METASLPGQRCRSARSGIGPVGGVGVAGLGGSAVRCDRRRGPAPAPRPRRRRGRPPVSAARSASRSAAPPFLAGEIGRQRVERRDQAGEDGLQGLRVDRRQPGQVGRTAPPPAGPCRPGRHRRPSPRPSGRCRPRRPARRGPPAPRRWRALRARRQGRQGSGMRKGRPKARRQPSWVDLSFAAAGATAPCGGRFRHRGPPRRRAARPLAR